MGFLPIHRIHSALVVCFFILFVSGSRAQSDDGQTLLELKKNLTDPQGSLSSWNLSTDFCQWTGIKCRNNTIQVISISLSGLSLQGSISPVIGKLRSLQSLDLSKNNLTGSIPKEITNCTQLQDVNLGSNQLTGVIPEQLGRLVSLTLLRLQQNRLQGQIPASIGLLKNLKKLRIHDNNLTGSIPKQIGNCTLLEFLELYDNGLEGGIPTELGKLWRLTHLSLQRNNLSGSLPKELSGCISLRRLSLSNNNFTGPIVGELGKLTNLQYFDAYNCNFEGNFPSELGNITGLLALDVSINRISGAIPKNLGTSWKQLGLLNMSQNSLTGAVPEAFGEMTDLTSLDLSFNNLSKALPASIGLLPNLTGLFISSNSFEGALPAGLGNSSTLKQLNASNNGLSEVLPSRLCSRGNLTVLALSNNNLKGALTSLLQNCSSLETFQASNNRFNGSIPPSLTSARLVLLDLSSNQLSGKIPAQIDQLTELRFLLLANNRLSGRIPNEVGLLPQLEALNLSMNSLEELLPNLFSLTSLRTLDLSHNLLTGPIPELGTLTMLDTLDFSSNNLSGPIPASFEKMTSLRQFNFSNNNFTGRIPQIRAFMNGPASAFLNNPGLCGPPLFQTCIQPASGPAPPPREQHRGKRNKSVGKAVGIAFIVVGGLFLCSGAIFLLFTYRALKSKKSTVIKENRFADKVPMLYAEIEKATEGFSDANVIGAGPHGTVYKGIYAWEKIVAVKVVPTQEEEDKVHYYFNAAARKLGRIRHPNIVILEGFIIYGGSKLFLYEYMPNRSLGEILHRSSRPRLDWNTRYKIAVGAAQGLSYLHHQCSIVHCDIKSSNILLDSAFVAHIGDIALAKLITDSRSLSAVDRSLGYIAPEATKVSLKADVYSFGIVLLELLTGRKPVMEDGTSLVQAVRKALADEQLPSDVVDPVLRNVNGPFQQEISTVLKVGLACTDPSPNRRPSMKEVVEVLNRIRREPGGPKLRSLRSFIHRRSFMLLSTQDESQ